MPSPIYDKAVGLDCYVMTPVSNGPEGILDVPQNEHRLDFGIPTPKQHYDSNLTSNAGGALHPEALSTACLPVPPPVWSGSNGLGQHQLASLSNGQGGAYSDLDTAANPTRDYQNLYRAEDSEARAGRARNAAEKRHNTNAKRMRLGHGMTQQERTREKNRIAAAKCRSKKKAALHVLEKDFDIVSTANKILRAEEQSLRAQLTLWRTLALQHSTDQDGCSCDLVQQYNTHQAMKAAKTAGGWAVDSFVDFEGWCSVTS